ncbi:phospholipase A2 inhibitor and Ly6/PLAUR domain-containing protein-like [Mixophyes fleayi]|uniref:phospholipase A2 inhibitor and Ly6/PLAUR domain-containing protein-like n=1 Tax=Mixophyes fleayi TaxID=3061075 RepID=UPI003F4D92F5
MTHSVLLLTSILSTLTATGYSLSCINCMDMSDKLCSGPAVSCSSSDAVCVLISTVTSLGGLGEHKMTVRDCGKPNACSVKGSMSVLSGKVKTGISCCSSDSCTPPMPVLPLNDYNKNGVTCKSCMEAVDKQCQSDTFMECQGNETKCISQVSTLKGPSMTMSTALRGCATKEACGFPLMENTIGDVTVKTYTSCTGGSPGLQYNLLLLLVSVILLLKFI